MKSLLRYAFLSTYVFILIAHTPVHIFSTSAISQQIWFINFTLALYVRHRALTYLHAVIDDFFVVVAVGVGSGEALVSNCN